jgi:hypothetical protein
MAAPQVAEAPAAGTEDRFVCIIFAVGSLINVQRRFTGLV